VGVILNCKDTKSAKGQQIDAGYRVDMLVENCIIIENKAVDQVLPIHQAQLLTYLKLRDGRLGFLLNWNVKLMRDGIKRMVNNYDYKTGTNREESQ
jgi:GxxExxY protein